RTVLISLTIQSSEYGIATTFTLMTRNAIASGSKERCTQAIARICAAITAHCAANSAMQVEILFADPINSTVISKNEADDASARATECSINPIDHLKIPANTTASNANAEATPRKSGTRYMRSFATALSITAIETAMISIFTTKASRSWP